MKKQLYALLLTGYACLATAQTTVETLEVPGAAEWCQIRPGGASVLPSGRYVTPAGKTQTVSNGAFGLALSPDEQTALVLHHNGVVSVVHGDRVTRIPDYGQEINRNAFLGVAFSPDGRTAWLSGGDQGVVAVFDVVNQRFTDTISLNGIFKGRKYEDSFTSDLCYWPQQQSLLVLDRGNNRLVQIRLKDRAITASIPVGRIPFGLALAPDGRHVLVYTLISKNYL